MNKDYLHLSHIHCWGNPKNPCGIPLSKHTQCCLCDLECPSTKPTTKIPDLSTLIKRWKFDCVSSLINDTRFPKPKEIGTDFKLCSFDGHVSSENVIKYMKDNGYRPANIYEILAWNEWNGHDIVVALGSVFEIEGHRRIPYFSRHNYGNRLSINWWDNDWYADFHFLAVRDLSSETKTDTPENSDTVTLTMTKEEYAALKSMLTKITK